MRLCLLGGSCNGVLLEPDGKRGTQGDAASTKSARSVLIHDASKRRIEIYRYLWRYLFSSCPKNPISMRIFDIPAIPVEAPRHRIPASHPTSEARTPQGVAGFSLSRSRCQPDRASGTARGALTPAQPVSANPATTPAAGFARGLSAGPVLLRRVPCARGLSRDGAGCDVFSGTAPGPRCARVRMPVETSA
jgi:hypothetical protein